MLRTLAIGVALLSFAALPARAEEADAGSRQTLALEIVEDMNFGRVIDDALQTLTPLVAQGMARDLHLGPAEAGRLQELLAEEFHNSTPDMVQGIASVYASSMSEQELRETVAFMRTPSGHAFAGMQLQAQEALQTVGASVGSQVGARALARLEAERSKPDR